MHQALYRKYRPQTFDDVYGQKHITDTLRFEVMNGKASHAYLFTGSRGTGKTTCAKIMAKVLNCENPQNGSPCLKCSNCLDIDAETAPDIVEMDAASHTGVDDIRDITENVSFTPAVAKKKVYIIDEVHMLSKAAFNALLKTIEEPPEHVVFILATTEIQKVPPTIISRCQRFDFRRIEMQTIANRLQYIAKNEGVELEENAALLLARQAQGGMRDAIGLFELCSSSGTDVTEAKVSSILGISGYDVTAKTMHAVADKNIKELFAIVDNVVMSSSDISVFVDELVSFVRDMLVVRYTDNVQQYLDLTRQEAETLISASKRFSLAQLVYMAKVLDDTVGRLTKSPHMKRIECEMALIKLASPELDMSAESINTRIAKLEAAFALSSDNHFQQQITPIVQPTLNEEIIDKTIEESNSIAENVATAENVESLVEDVTSVTDNLNGSRRSIVSFLQSSAVYVSADKKSIRIETDSFCASMLSSEDAKSGLSDAFALSGITDGRPSIEISISTKKIKKSSPSDELGDLF